VARSPMQWRRGFTGYPPLSEYKCTGTTSSTTIVPPHSIPVLATVIMIIDAALGAQLKSIRGSLSNAMAAGFSGSSLCVMWHARDVYGCSIKCWVMNV